MANSTLTNLLTDIADAIREKNGASGSIPALEFPDRIRSISGGGSDCMPAPDEYHDYITEAKNLYTGDYANIAIVESDNILNVAFLMDDFTVLSYDEASTEFTAIGWLYCEYNKDAQTWRVVDYRTVASTGTNYVKHIRYSSVYWKYNGKTIFPVGASGGGGGGAGLNIAYGDTAPDDTTKLWVNAAEPSSVKVTTGLTFGDNSIASVGVMGKAITNMASGKVGSKVYLFGGYSGGRLNTISSYDTATGELKTLSATLPTAASGISAGVVGDKIYLFGGSTGSNQNKIHRFDTATETIETLSVTLPKPLSEIGVGVIGERIYLLGGKASQATNTVYVFDTATETIATLATTLPENRKGMAAGVVGTKIYLLGGHDVRGNYMNTIVAFDTTTETFETMEATLPTAAYDFGYAVIGAKIYLFGGWALKALDTICVFDAGDGSLTTLDLKLPVAGNGISALSFGSRIYLFGGAASTINVFSASVPLAPGAMVLQYASGGSLFPIINSDALTIEVGVVSAHIGDASGAAQPVDVFAYKNGAWATV